MQGLSFSSFLFIKSLFFGVIKEKKYLWIFVVASAVLLINVATTAFSPLIFKNIIDKLEKHDFTFLIFLLLAYGFVWTFGKLSLHFREILMNQIIERSTRVLCFDSLKKLFQLPQKYHVDRKTGEITNMLNRAQHNLPTILWGVTLHIFPVILELVVVCVILSQNAPFDLLCILLITLMVYGVYSFYTLGSFLQIKERSIKADKAVEIKFVDWLQNLELIKTFGKAKHVLQEYEELLGEKEDLECKFSYRAGRIRIGNATIIGIGLTFLIYVLGRRVQDGSITLGDFVMFNSYFIQFISPITTLSYIVRDVQKALLEMKDVVEFLTSRQSEVKKAHAVKHLEKNIDIEFKNVSFCYDKTLILKDLSFKIEPGETAFIIGPSGAGKSTLVKLLLRQYEPTAGTILINGKDIREICLDAYQDLLGFTLQDTPVLDSSIEDNITLFSKGFSEEDITRAASRASILHRIESQQDKINSGVGERGAKLSGGERQRISLARIFLNNPRLCILDEPTASLDSNTKSLIYKNLEKFLPEATKVIVTHNYENILSFHQIIKLQS